MKNRHLGKQIINPPFLTSAGTITIQLPEPFDRRDFFVRNTKENAPVKISNVGADFTACFLGQTAERAEGAVPSGWSYRTSSTNGATEVILCYQTLSGFSLDRSIIAALGGESKAETPLVVVAVLMQKQANGERGVLLTNGYANIFYIRNTDGVLRAVYVLWGGDGWDVHAYSVEDPFGWGAGSQVFSRDSSV